MRLPALALLAALATVACDASSDADTRLRAGERYALLSIDRQPLPVVRPLPAPFGDEPWEFRVLADTIAVEADSQVQRVQWRRFVELEALPCNALRGMMAPGSGGITMPATPLPPTPRDSSCDALRTEVDTTLGRLDEDAGMQVILYSDRRGARARASVTWQADTLRLSVDGDSTIYLYRRVTTGRDERRGAAPGEKTP